MKYIAHREEDREQLLLDHLTGTAEKRKNLLKSLARVNGDIAVECCMI